MAKKAFPTATVETVRKMIPLDDTLFQKMCEDKGVCQEIISTILGQEVKVLQVIPQDSIGNLQGRAVRLDCLCRLKGGILVNIEVQKRNDDDHEARVRYNASVITSNKTPKSTKFKDIQKVVVIFISAFDMYGKGFPIYHVDRVVRETGDVVKNGFTEIYVNTVAKKYDNELNANVSDLMDLFVDRDTFNTEKFPEFSKRKNTFVNTQKGERIMCQAVQDLIDETRKEGKLTDLFEYVEQGLMTVANASKAAKLTKEKFKEEMALRGYTVPQRKNSKAAAAS